MDGRDVATAPLFATLASKVVSGIRPVTDLQDRVWESAIQLKLMLSQRSVNIVTVESLTCGMMAKTLIDIPGSGAVVYGGFSTYDTDAKRVMVGVKTRGVYSHYTAQQMAEGALRNSRAMVAIAVTGNAMPYPTENDMLGRVWIACSLRTRDGFTSKSIELNVQDTGDYKPLFDSWRAQNQGGDKWAPRALTAVVADIIRLQTTATAFDFVENLIKLPDSLAALDSLQPRAWDTVLPPSFILAKHIQPPINPMPKEPTSTDDTNWTGYAQASVSSSTTLPVDGDIDNPDVQALSDKEARAQLFMSMRSAVVAPLAALVPSAEPALIDAGSAVYAGYTGTLDDFDSALGAMARAISEARDRIRFQRYRFGLMDAVENKSVPSWLVEMMASDPSMPRGFQGTAVLVDSPTTGKPAVAAFHQRNFRGTTSHWLADTRIVDRDQFNEAWRAAVSDEQDIAVQKTSPHLRGPYRFINGPVYWYWSTKPSSRVPAAK